MTKRSGPSFLVQNRLGIYCYQRRIPKSIRSVNAFLPKLVRISLRTRSKTIALRFARTIAVMWDQRAQQYFRSEEDFHRGMKLLQEYLAACSRFSSFEDLSTNFLDLLDDTTDSETDLLNSASRFRISKALDLGEDPYASHLNQLSQLIQQAQTTITGGNSTHISDVKLSVAFEDFLTVHRANWKEIGGSEKTYRQSYFPLLLGVTGDINTNQITKAHINDLVKILLVYPANKNKIEKYKNLAVRDFLTVPADINDRQKPYTTKKYKGNIGTFLRWLRTSDYTSIDLDAPLAAIKIKKSVATDDQSVFTSDDIRKLFNSKQYVQGLHKTASRFWVPLIGLYTGARLNEICQLGKDDIYIEESTARWVISFNENDDVENKSIKKPHHARLVPIHKKLIELGLLDYVKLITKKNSMIFPDLTYRRDENKYGHDIQRWFNRTYLNKRNCNVTTENTSFHSFRHTLISHLSIVHNLHENKMAKGVGQLPKGGEYETRYSKQNAFIAYEKNFDLIDFDNCYDSKKIKHWKKQAFFKTLK